MGLKALLVLAIPMIAVSWMVMVVINTIVVSHAVLPVFRHFEDPKTHAERKIFRENIAPKDSLDHLIWFLQITDLHISEHVDDDNRIPQLMQFCTETVDAIRPSVVIASGDLTDAKTLGNWGSEQHEWEWKEYARILRDTGVSEKTVWLDIRGNHDAFNVPSRLSKLNYFRTHAKRGNQTSYHYVHRYGYDRISFIGVDACPDPGFRRPFNFFGVLAEGDMKQLAIFAEESKSSNVTIWFGHYPTSVISSAAPGIAEVMSNGIAYLSGHLHTLGGLLPELYALQKSGTLELELGDWKDNRLYRIVAVDHDLLSFTDCNFTDWPQLLITNPKNVRFFAPVHEPLDRISRSTHVRVLAFSPKGIASVKIQLPGETVWTNAVRVGDSPLYVMEWDPSDYAFGVHTIRVLVRDGSGREKEVTQEFATRNAEVPSFSIMRRLILMGDLGKLFATLAVGITFANIFVLVAFKTNTCQDIYSVIVRQSGRHGIPPNLIRELHDVLSIPWVFWPLALCTAYTLTMPWFYGDIVEGSHGIVFAYGIWIDGQWLHGQMTYMFAVTHLMIHCSPLTLCTVLYVRSRRKFPGRKLTHVVYHVGFLFLIISQLWSLRIFWDSYGAISVVTNGVLVWSGIIPTLFLWWKAFTLNPSSSSRQIVGRR